MQKVSVTTKSGLTTSGTLVYQTPKYVIVKTGCSCAHAVAYIERANIISIIRK